MAGEIQCAAASGRTLYALIRDRTGNVWNTNSSTFVAYATANYAQYTIALTEQGVAAGFYTGTFPAQIAAGVYSVTAKQQIGGLAAETDPNMALGDMQWNGSAVLPLSDAASSGQVAQFAPLRLARGTQILNYKFYLRSASDGRTPFVSGICSGQINRDGGTWGALQSGAFTEEGLGFYHVQALTSGDLLCNTASLLFTATGVSGGTSDPCPLTLVTQRTSGQ